MRDAPADEVTRPAGTDAQEPDSEAASKQQNPILVLRKIQSVDVEGVKFVLFTAVGYIVNLLLSRRTC